MNRRLRITLKSSKKRDAGYNRYLKPGALAQLRDSRINARSSRIGSTQISLYRMETSSSPSTLPSPTTIQVQIDGIPCFAGRIYGPRCPQRKKIVATKSVLILCSNPSSPVSDSTDPIAEV